MAMLQIRALLWVLGVLACWLMIAAAIVVTVPAPGQATQTPTFFSPIGRSGHIYVPSRVAWTIPTGRDTFDDYYHAVWVDDGDAINEALSRPGWIAIIHGQAVRIVDIDTDAVQVEVWDGPHAGEKGWVKAHHLNPQ
jgi:hypothetical protein